MTTVVFVGPTISESDVLSVIDAICLPPVAQGDVYRALAHNPTYIGIIDGYFDGVAAVWHKEILWALSQGVHVFGAASMGALRAAELADFGMTGVGTIYDHFRIGKFEDDDEVAVVHGPPEIGFPALSEPLVNIRATLEQAVSNGILQQSVANELMQMAKSTHYRQRSWDNLITRAGLSEEFTDWLKNGQINQKHQDAIAMLQAISEKLSHGPSVHLANFDFEWTNQWDNAVSQWQQEDGVTADNDQLIDQFVLDELRLRSDDFSTAKNAAMLRYALNHPWRKAGQSGKRGNAAIEKSDLVNAINTFRMEHNLLNRAQLDQWLAENRLTTTELEKLLADEVSVKSSIDPTSETFNHILINYLKLTGAYHDLATLAKKKRDRLTDTGHADPHPQSTGLPNPALLEWYFCQRCDAKIPPDIDQYAHDLGLQHRDELYQMLARAYLYLQSGERK